VILPDIFYPPSGKYSQYLIYGLVDPRTGEVRYIGKTCSGFLRIRQHFVPSQLCRITKKINWLKSLFALNLLPKPIILAESLTRELLSELEIKFIAEYKAKGFNLLNMTVGGDGNNYKGNPSGITGNKGIKHTDATKAAMRNAHLGKKRKPRTLEEKRKLSISNRRAHAKESKPFICLQNGKTYNCQREAVEELGVPDGNLSGALNGNRKTVKGYSFKYV